MENYKVSIVLPVYNGEKYLAKALDSILNQTYSNFELIIIDDCSTDASNSIAREYAKKDSRIFIKKNRENKKLPRSLNAGFHFATGDLFTWTSDDNILLPHTIERMVEIFKSNKMVDFVYADIIPIDDMGRKKDMPYLNGEISDIYVINPVLACFLYKKEVHNRLKGYNPRKFLYEDYDFWIRTYEAGFNMFHLKEKLYFYRFHDNSLTSTRKKESIRIQIKLLFIHLRKEKRIKQKCKIINRLIKLIID